MLIFNSLGSEQEVINRMTFIKKTLSTKAKNPSTQYTESINFIDNEIKKIDDLNPPYHDNFTANERERVKNYLKKVRNIYEIKNNNESPSILSSIWNWLTNYSSHIIIGMIIIGTMFFGHSLIAKEDNTTDSNHSNMNSKNNGHHINQMVPRPTKVLWKTKLSSMGSPTLSNPIIVSIDNKQYIFLNGFHDYYLIDIKNGKIIRKDSIEQAGFVSPIIPLYIKNHIFIGGFNIGKFLKDDQDETSKTKLTILKKMSKGCWNIHSYFDDVYCFAEKNKIFQYSFKEKIVKEIKTNLRNQDFYLPYSVKKDNVVYLAGGSGKKGALAAFDLKTKKLKWKKEIIQDDADNYLYKMIIKNNALYFSTYEGKIYSFNIKTKKINWKNTEFTKLKKDFPNTLTVHRGNLASDGKYLYACLIDNQLVKINANTGKVKEIRKWKDSNCHSPTITNNQIIIGFNNTIDGSVLGIDKNNINNTKWKLTGGGGGSVPPLIKNKKFYYFSEFSGYLYAIGN